MKWRQGTNKIKVAVWDAQAVFLGTLISYHGWSFFQGQGHSQREDSFRKLHSREEQADNGIHPIYSGEQELLGDFSVNSTRIVFYAPLFSQWKRLGESGSLQLLFFLNHGGIQTSSSPRTIPVCSPRIHRTGYPWASGTREPVCCCYLPSWQFLPL